MERRSGAALRGGAGVPYGLDHRSLSRADAHGIREHDGRGFDTRRPAAAYRRSHWSIRSQWSVSSDRPMKSGRVSAGERSGRAGRFYSRRRPGDGPASRRVGLYLRAQTETAAGTYQPPETALCVPIRASGRCLYPARVIDAQRLAGQVCRMYPLRAHR